MKNRNRLLAELTENCWAIYPEQYSFILNFLLGNISPDKALAEEMREKTKEVQKENSSIIGNTGIAYMPIMGMISPRRTFMTNMCGGVALSDLTREFNLALEDNDVKGIIFDVDGPGGAATGVNEFTNLVYNARGVKPVYAYVGGTAASATYWITSAADKIFGDATARLGSVGTVVGVPKKDKESSYVEITNSLSPYKRPDVENEDHFKNIVKYLDDMTDVFYGSLARNFDLAKDYVIDNFGKGGMKVGQTALSSKMFHEINSFAGTVESMLEALTSPERGASFVFDLGNRVDTINPKNVNAKLFEVKGGFMDLKELKEKHPGLVLEIEEAASATASKKTEENLSAIIAEKEAENARLAVENQALSEKAAEKEKEALQSRIETSKTKAKAIFTEKLSNSVIPENLHKKVDKQVPVESFINEEGNLDESGYSESLSSEITDWEASFSSNFEISGVKTKKEEEKEEENKETEVDETVARLLAMAK